MGSFLHCNIPRKGSLGRYMHKILNHTIVFDGGGGIDNAMVAYFHICINANLRHNHRTFSYLRKTGNKSARMMNGFKLAPVFNLMVYFFANMVISNRDNYFFIFDQFPSRFVNIQPVRKLIMWLIVNQIFQ